MVIDYVPLASCIVEGVAIALAREVEPLITNGSVNLEEPCFMKDRTYFWMSKFISFEV